MPKLEDLELKIKQTGDTKSSEIVKVANALSKLAEHGARMKVATKSLGEFNSEVKRVKTEKANALAAVANGLAKVTKAASEGNKAASNIRDITDALDEMVNRINISKLSSISSAMTEIKGATRGFRKLGVSDDTTKKLGDSAPSNSDIGGVTEQATSKLDRFKAALKEIGRIGRTALSKVGSALKSVGKAALEGGKHLASMGWDKLKSKVTGLISPLQNLVHSFARIAMYRALRTAIKAITTGFSEGIKHLYEWARVSDNVFKSSMDSLATSAHYLRDSLGAMASPLIDALAPAIEFVVEKFVALLNVINQFIATFTGASSWRRAVRTPTEYSSGLEDAAKSAKKATEAQKKLNKALMDFDELNLITTSTTKGSNPSSPSGSGGGEDYSTHFVEEPIADWIQAIKNAIDNGDWYGAGKLLADHLNGIIDAWDARAWGEKLGEKVENGLKFYLGFMDNFKWGTLGIKAGDFINGVLSKIDPNDLGRAMVAHVKAGLKFLANFAWTVDLSPLGTAFGVAFNELFSKDTMNDLAMTISGFVNNAIGIAYNFVTTADWAEMGKNVMQAIFTAIGNIEWGTAGATVGKLATGLLDAVLNALDYAISHIDVILQAVYDFAAELLGHLWNWLVDKVSGLLKEFWNYVKEHFFDSGVDDGNGRKDSRDLGMTPFSQTTTNPDPIEQDYIVNYKSNNYNTMKAQRAVLSANVSPTVIWTESGYKKVLEHRTALGKQISTTVKFKPVVETSANKGTTTSLLSSKQLSKLLDLRAEGGFPNLTQGSMFIGGERPGEAEMVGNIHGKTGVASGKEITGIADAVYNTGETEAELLRQQNSLLRQLLAKNTSVTLAPTAAAGKWVSQAQTAYARATG